MKKSYRRIIGIGMLALVLSGPALAHDPGQYSGYRNDTWGGSATVWGDSTGYTGYSGTLSYGAGYGYAPGYAPGYVPGSGHRHVAACRHQAGHGYAQGYRNGYKHGRKNGHHRGRGHH